MEQQTKIFTWTLVGLLMLALAGTAWFFMNKKTATEAIKNVALPVVSQINSSNNSGKLFGPQEATKAPTLAAEKIVELTNQYRKEAGVKPLTINTTLTKAAQTKTDDMFAKQYFEHIAPDGTTPAQLVLKTGYNYKTTGENLALGDFKDEADLVKAWYDSPGHRANMLNADFTEIGVASDLNDFEGRNTWISVQEFGRLAPNCTKPDDKLSETITAEKATYQSQADKMNALVKTAQTKTDEANQNMTQGNEIYNSTKDKSKAQPYWDEAKTLAAQATQSYNEAKAIDAQLKILYETINSNMSKYNTQVNSYNICIKK